MKILAISDKIVDTIYTPLIADRMKDIDFILSCEKDALIIYLARFSIDLSSPGLILSPQ